MLTIEKYAAIDIGSSAIRLLITTIIEQEGKETQFKKASLVRVPIRLGTDVFLNGKISKKNYLRIVDALIAFRLLMKTHNVVRYRACATSAMREALNGKKIVENLYKETDIKIEIIDGNDEAAIIATADIILHINNDKAFLYVDVGGGSTELTIFVSGLFVNSRSFDLGTIRLVSNKVEDSVWKDMKDWIITNTSDIPQICLLGTGGNINNTHKNSGKKIGEPLSYLYLSTYYKNIKAMTYEERIVNLNMNPDRADVIVPAIKIYLSAMKWSGAKDMYVPKIGLSDGIIRSLYKNKKQ